MDRQDRKWKSLLALVTLVGVLVPAGTALGNDDVGLGISPQLTVRWWQWVASIPSSVHPLSQKNIDPTGAGYCMVGQQGAEWFLGGVFKVVDISPGGLRAPRAPSSAIVPVEVVRECHTIPLGKTILIPVLNGECNTAEELALGNDVPKDLVARVRYLRTCAKTLGDAVRKDTAAAAFGPVNAAGHWTPSPVPVKRVHTVLPFAMTYAPDNLFSHDCPGPGGFLCDPKPNPSLAQVDGYWAQVRPPTPGTYMLQTFGEAPAFEFALRITYTLKVVGPQDQ